MPGPVGLRIRQAAAGHQEKRVGQDAARAEAFDPHGGKRRHQSEQQEAQAGADEVCSVFQPKSSPNGRKKAPGMPRTADALSGQGVAAALALQQGGGFASDAGAGGAEGVADGQAAAAPARASTPSKPT